MPGFQRAKAFLEYMGGASDVCPPGAPSLSNYVAWGLWWAVLFGIILAFSGQSSKFIYIDF